MSSWIDITVIVVYLVGTTLFGCSFYFRKSSGDKANTFMTGGGRLPTWVIALSVFATYISSISFLALPEGAYAGNWWGWINSITLPVATFIAGIWFVPFYRRATSVSAYSFLEKRFGSWARVYASSCFLVMQSVRSGVILLLLSILVNQLLGFSYESIIFVTGMATLVYSMLGGFAAVVWADAIQSIILIVGTLVCVACLLIFTPDVSGSLQAAWEAGKISLGSLDISDWGSNTFWVLFFYGICINLQNFGVDQCYTQRYVAAKDEKAAVRSMWGSVCLCVPVTLLFTVIGTLLWMYSNATGAVPPGMKAAEVFPWFIMNKLPTGFSGLLVAAIIAAAMSTVSSTLNSGSTVLLEDYWKRFFPARAGERANMVFLRLSTLVLAFMSIGVALSVVWIWGRENKTVLGMWYVLQGVFSGGMLGLFLIGAFSKRTLPWHAVVATFCGFASLAWVMFGQRILPLPWPLHKNLSIVFATMTIVTVGFLLGSFRRGQAVSR